MSTFIKLGNGQNEILINKRYISSIEHDKIIYESIDEGCNYPHRMVSFSITSDIYKRLKDELAED